jgi:hypothetical protein
MDRDHPMLPAEMQGIINSGLWPRGYFKLGPRLQKVAPHINFSLDLHDDEGHPPPFMYYHGRMMLDVEHPDSSRNQKLARGSRSGPVELPWLDVEKALIIGVNAYPGDDTFFVLDYRQSMISPIVVTDRFAGRSDSTPYYLSDWVFLARDWREFLDGLEPCAAR